MKKFLKEILPYLIIIVVVIIIRTFIITPVSVDGPSMNNTLFDKDINYKFFFAKNFSKLYNFLLINPNCIFSLLCIYLFSVSLPCSLSF